LMNKRFFDLSFSGAGSSFLWRVFVISFMEISLILSIVLTIMPKKEALNFISGTAYGYLVSGWAPLIWVVLPLAFMFMVYKRNRY